MTDYFPLIHRAVAGLQNNTGESRRALYERARGALVQQLRGQTPALSEAEITRERLALEEAIRRVEADTARRNRPAPGGAGAPQQGPSEMMAQGRRPRPPEEPRGDQDGVRGFRDVVAEAETLGDRTAQASRSARNAYASAPSGRPDLDRLEPRHEPDHLRAGGHDDGGHQGRGGEHPDEDPEVAGESRSRSRRGLVAALLTLLVLVALGATAYWQRERIAGLFGGVSNVVQRQTPRDNAPGNNKIADRIGQEGQDASRSGARSANDQAKGQQAAAVAQRVILYEEDPAEPNGKRYVGSAIWRTETVQSGPNNSPDVAVRGDIEVPERRIAMTLSLRRNSDPALPASHTLEVMFTLPADFPYGGVANVAAILMKQQEQSRGAPLTGLSVKVTSGFFLVGLSAIEADVQRNIQLLKERGWFDVPIVYNNGRRAILAVEKGTPGDKAFSDAFGVWNQ